MRLLAAAFSASALVVAGAGSSDAQAQGGLTARERRWVQGTWPVVEQARRAGLPVDIVVQPQAAPDAAPLALAFLGGRCKLVFSLRENPSVRKQEQGIEQDLGPGEALLDAALEVMAAHELFGHCARHVAGLWHAVPTGYFEPVPVGLDPALHDDFCHMRGTRREEGYADLAALAWAHSNRHALYARLHAWLVAERGRDRVEGSHHDTLAWLRKAGPGRTATAEVWRDVLLDEAMAGAHEEAATRTARN